MGVAADRPLSRLEKGLLCFFFLGLIPLFGALVEYRTALGDRRMGDLDCFLRAAWAVRTGGDPYAVTSDNDWHYNYPPLYAILLAPLADPPAGQDTSGYVPYPISTAICFLLSLSCLAWGAHVLAAALEEQAMDGSLCPPPRFCRRWWLLRLCPVFICLLPIGHTLMRGQVNLIVLAALCAALADWMRRRNFRAGLWLAFAVCIKVIPVYLLVYPLWKRDVRGLLGCCAGLLAGLVLIPVLAFGPAKTQTHYQTYAKVFLGPFLNISEDDSRKGEILGVNATDSIGVKNALHNWMHPDPAKRPEDLPGVGKAAYLLLGFAMTFLTLWPFTHRHRDSPGQSAHPFAALIVLMAIFSPVCHSHYLTFCVPIVMSLLASHWQLQDAARQGITLAISFTAFIVTVFVAYLPGLEILKDRCAALFATLPLWAIPVVQMWRGGSNVSVEPVSQESRKAA